MSEDRKSNMRRPLLLALGGIALVGGLALLGVGLFGVLGGDSQAHLTVVQVSPQASKTPAPAVDPTPQPGPPLGDAPYTMIIDKIGVNAPVRTYGLDPATLDKVPTPEVPTGPDAASVVAWYDFSAKPGTSGNAIFAGHVSWFGTAVFASLESVGAGDVIRLIGQDGTEVNYTVSAVMAIDPNDPNAISLLHQTDTPVLTIVTCGGTFVQTNDPVFGGEYSNRIVVRGELASVKHPGGPVAAALGD